MIFSRTWPKAMMEGVPPELHGEEVVGGVEIAWTTAAEAEQAAVFIEALKVYGERNRKYNDNWKRMGWRGQLIRIRERAERLWDHLWDVEPDDLDSEYLDKHTDDALDLINFSGFLVRAVGEGNRDGSWWEGK